MPASRHTSQPPQHDPPVAQESPAATVPDGRMTIDGLARWILPEVQPHPDRVPYVRHQIATVLDLWGLDDLAWSVELLVTELAGNVVRHARTLFTLSLTWDGRLLHGEVTDADPTPPQPRLQQPLDQAGGRGLLLVGEIADSWGVDTHQHGKTIWFELAPAAPPAPAAPGTTSPRREGPRRRQGSRRD